MYITVIQCKNLSHFINGFIKTLYMSISAYMNIGGKQLVEILKALAEETRLRIFSQVIKGDMCVCEVEECLGLTQSNASRHLNALKKAGILDSYKSAQWTYYKMSEKFIENNKDLYSYIVNKSKELNTYDVDSKKFKSCKTNDICACKNTSKENLK